MAIVEQINSDGSIVTSNSGWGSSYFWTETLYPSNGYVASWCPAEAYVQGFIYLDISPSGPGPMPNPSPGTRRKRGKAAYYTNPWLFLKGRYF